MEGLSSGRAVCGMFAQTTAAGSMQRWQERRDGAPGDETHAGPGEGQMRVHMCTVLSDMRWPASRDALAPLSAEIHDWTPSCHITWRAGAGEIHQALEVNKHEALQSSNCDQQFSHTALAMRLHNLDMHWQFPPWQQSKRIRYIPGNVFGTNAHLAQVPGRFRYHHSPPASSAGSCLRGCLPEMATLPDQSQPAHTSVSLPLPQPSQDQSRAGLCIVSQCC